MSLLLRCFIVLLANLTAHVLPAWIGVTNTLIIVTNYIEPRSRTSDKIAV